MPAGESQSTKDFALGAGRKGGGRKGGKALRGAEFEDEDMANLRHRVCGCNKWKLRCSKWCFGRFVSIGSKTSEGQT